MTALIGQCRRKGRSARATVLSAKSELRKSTSAVEQYTWKPKRPNSMPVISRRRKGNQPRKWRRVGWRRRQIAKFVSYRV